MTRRAKKLNRDPMTLLKQSVCGRCGGLKLVGKCEDCESEWQRLRALKEAHPEQFACNNWALRTAEDKQRNTLAKRQSRKLERLNSSGQNNRIEPANEQLSSLGEISSALTKSEKDKVLEYLRRVQRAARLDID